MTVAPYVHPTAIVEQSAVIGDGTRVWHHAHVRGEARVGSDCVLGKGVYVDADVVVGNRVKIQNNASLYRGAIVDDGVFIGPHCVLTNDRVPRAITPDGMLKNDKDWQAVGVHLGYGASIGAGSTVLGGVSVGRWALIGAGSLVTADVPDHALAYGQPARVQAFVCRCGKARATTVAALECGCLGR